MKKIVSASVVGKLALAWLILFPLHFSAFAQSQQPTYIMLTYLKTDRGKASQYLDAIKKGSSKVWEARVKSGELDFFSLYSVNKMRTNPEDEYDYVAIMGAHSLKPMMDPAKTTRELLKEMMPAIDEHTLDLTQAELPSIRVVHKQEVLRLLDIINGEGTKFYEINYMKAAPGKNADYVTMEKNVFKAVHMERKAKGEITGWGFWEVAYPYSDKREYDFVTANALNDWDKFVNSDYTAAYKKAFPTGDINKLAAQATATRTMVKTEVWKRELHVDGK